MGNLDGTMWVVDAGCMRNFDGCCTSWVSIVKAFVIIGYQFPHCLGVRVMSFTCSYYWCSPWRSWKSWTKSGQSCKRPAFWMILWKQKLNTITGPQIQKGGFNWFRVLKNLLACIDACFFCKSDCLVFGDNDLQVPTGIRDDETLAMI